MFKNGANKNNNPEIIIPKKENLIIFLENFKPLIREKIFKIMKIKIVIPNEATNKPEEWKNDNNIQEIDKN